MEDLIDTLDASLNVSLSGLCSDKQCPRLDQYKMKSSKNNQEERRKRMLEAQKQKRFDYQNHVRKLAEADYIAAQEEESPTLTSDPMDVSPQKSTPYHRYRNQLMLSEWLVEVPSDFEDNWIIVPSPVGKRCLLVASRGRTKVFAKSGYKISEFSSLLPGGSPQNPSDSTILDCLWNEHKQCYFVLDLLSWSKTPFLGCEAQFRFYWLQSKFTDEPELGVKSSRNKYPLIRLPFTSCSPGNIESLMKESEEASYSPLDGLLFYHKLGFYTPKVTPLVGWLKPFMLPEVLRVPVPESFLQKKPEKYENLKEHLKTKKTSSQPSKNKVDSAPMEISRE